MCISIYIYFIYLIIYLYMYIIISMCVCARVICSHYFFMDLLSVLWLPFSKTCRIVKNLRKKGHQIQLEVRKSKLPAAWHLAHSWFNSIRTRTHKNIHVQSSTVMCSLQKGKGRCYLLPSWGAHVAKMYWSSQRLLHVTVGQYTQTLHWRERWT
jgi:hypothetical protein